MLTLPTYEYIVIGSGPGGAPLACNLAKAGHSVLLLEAGSDQWDNRNQQIPAFHAYATDDASMRWDYFVKHYDDPERARKDSKIVWEEPGGGVYVGLDPPEGAKMKGVLYPRAGTLGGCSSHHAMITLYPHASDWDGIAELTGDESWKARNMRKYFEKLERCEYVPKGTPGHGFEGWLGTDRADVGLVLGDVKIISILKAAAGAVGNGIIGRSENLLGILLRDINSDEERRDEMEAIYQLPLSTTNGKRSGTRGLLVETRDAKNANGLKKYPLDIRTDCLATKVIIENATNVPKAVGVEFLDGGSLYRADPRSNSAKQATKGRVMVSREVILAAGAFNTPQLLKLSGVGPAEELEELRIPIVLDSPGVGSNLQDRYEVGVVSKLEEDFQVIKKCTFGKPDDPCLKEWVEGRGPYESNGLTVGIVKKSSVAEHDPDIFIFGGPAYFKGYFPSWSERTVADKEHFTWTVLKAHTRNQAGRVMLRSADPQDPPDIRFNYFDTGTRDGEADKLDLTAIAEGVAFARRIMNGVGFFGGHIKEEVPSHGIASVEQVRDFVKNEAWGHHASCTCPIGPDGDRKAVLDSKFRVRGVNGLRVVDACVFPRIPGMFIILPIMMISEKASDVILEDIV